MEKNLLYESKGASKKFLKFYITLAIICLILSVVCLTISNAKYKSYKTTTGYTTSDGTFHGINSGYMGGGDVLSTEGKQMFRILSIACVICSIALFSIYNRYRHCWVKIYSDHIEGQALSIGKHNNQFSFFVSDIQSITVSGFNILLQLSTKNYILVFEDPNKANEILQSLIHNKY